MSDEDTFPKGEKSAGLIGCILFLASLSTAIAPATLGCGRIRYAGPHSEDGSTSDGSVQTDGLAADRQNDANFPPSCTAEPRSGSVVRRVGPGEPYASIGTALSEAQPGDVVRIRAGVYREEANLNSAVAITPMGDGPVVIDGECLRNHGVTISSPDADIRCIEIKRTTESAIYIDGIQASNLNIENNFIHDFNCGNTNTDDFSGIFIQRSGPGVHIVGNDITFRIELAVVTSLTGGITFTSSDDEPSGGMHVIARNRIAGVSDGIQGSHATDIHGYYDHDSIIEDNEITSCSDDGITVNGGAINVVVRRNQIRDCKHGIDMAPITVGPATIENNLIMNLSTSSGKCFDIEGAGRINVTANTCTAGYGIALADLATQAGVLISRHNRFQVSNKVLNIQLALMAGSNLDEDCIWSSGSTLIHWQGTDYADLASFQTATGQEPSGRQTMDCSWLPP